METALFVLIVVILIQFPLGIFVEIHRRRVNIKEEYGIYIIIAPVAGIIIFLYYWNNRTELASTDEKHTTTDS